MAYNIRLFQYIAKVEPLRQPEPRQDSWFQPLSTPQTNFAATVKNVAMVAALAGNILCPILYPGNGTGSAATINGPVFSKSIDYQDIAYTPLSENITLDKWYQPLQDVPRRIFFQNSLQEGITELGSPIVQTADRWWRDLETPPNGKPRAAHYQDFIYGPLPIVQTADRWWQPLSEPVRRIFFQNSLQEGITELGNPIIQIAWWRDLETPPKAKPRAVEYPAFTYGAAPIVQTTDRWWQPLSEPVRRIFFQNSLQEGITELGSPIVSTIDRWLQPLSEPVRRIFFQNSLQEGITELGQPITSSTQNVSGAAATINGPLFSRDFIYQDISDAIQFTAETITVDKWWADLSVPPKGRPNLAEIPQPVFPPFVFGASTQIGGVAPGSPVFSRVVIYQNIAYVPVVATETVTVDKWFKPLEDPVRLRPALRTGDNQDLFFDPNPFIKIDWFAPLSDPNKLTKPALVIGSYPYEFRNPFPFVKIDWFNRLNEPVRLKPGLLSPNQQFPAFDPAVFVKIDWYEWLNEPVRLKPGLLVTEQLPFTAGFVPIIPSVTNWYRPLNEPVRFRILPPHLQQAIAFTAITNLVNVVRFSRGYIIA